MECESKPNPMFDNHPQYKENPEEFKKGPVTRLANSPYYEIHFVYITLDRKSGQYLLAGFHNGRMLIYKKYKTIKGAKVGFIKNYGCKAFKKGVKPVWTNLYKF